MIPAQSRRLKINFVQQRTTERTTCSCSARLLPRSGFLILIKTVERVTFEAFHATDLLGENKKYFSLLHKQVLHYFCTW